MKVATGHGPPEWTEYYDPAPTVIGGALLAWFDDWDAESFAGKLRSLNQGASPSVPD
jgi:hypothetical protein